MFLSSSSSNRSKKTIGRDFFFNFLLVDPSWGQFHQRVYAQLLRSQIPKTQNLLNSTVFLVLSGSECVKAARKMLVKLTLGIVRGLTAISLQERTKNVTHMKHLTHLKHLRSILKVFFF